ncbi:MAG: hypothetical protein AAF682_09440 [Planctomycetota bacterium]
MAVLFFALAPSFGTLDAPLISDDTSALAYVAREAPFADWGQPQYGMRVIRFWRPLVTASLDVQELLTGVDPVPLRRYNLAWHAAGAVLAGLLALRLGAGRPGALAAGLLAGSFPEHGGTVTWIVGRVDSQTVPLVLLACWLALGRGAGAALGAALTAFLACASKELAFCVPALGLTLALARGGALRAALGTFLPLLVGASVAFLARRAALGTWVGGYPVHGLGPAAALAAGRAAVSFLWPVLVAGTAALLLSRAKAPAWRAAAFGVAAAGAALLPLFPLLSDGLVEEQNRRVLFLADALLAVAVGAGLRPRPGRAALVALLPVLLAVLVRAEGAFVDAREWADAAALAESHVARAREAVAGVPASEDPVFDSTFPREHGGAYCLAWGAADRFRAPFEASPRPVWPLRVLFAQRTPGERERRYVYRPHDHLVWPFGRAQRMVPEIPVTVGGERDFGPLVLDESVATVDAGGAVLEIWGTYTGRFEFLVYTELGYEPGTWGPAEGGVLELDPGGIQSPVRRVTLGDVLRLGTLATLGDALIQAADTGATRAYLELRVVDDARGIQNRPVAASRMLPLVWDAGLLERLGVGD